MWAASLHALMLFHPVACPCHGDSSQFGDETAHAHPELTCGLAIGLEPPLCGFGVRGAALDPASHEKINLRGKSALSRCQHTPCAPALIEWFLDFVAGVHLALLPVRRRERPCAELHSCFADQL